MCTRANLPLPFKSSRTRLVGLFLLCYERDYNIYSKSKPKRKQREREHEQSLQHLVLEVWVSQHWATRPFEYLHLSDYLIAN